MSSHVERLTVAALAEHLGREGDGGEVSRETLTACDVCGDAVVFDDETAPEYVCTCCLGVICSKHQANPSCPHAPADHDEPPAELPADLPGAGDWD